VSDGTAAGTTLVKDIRPGTGPSDPGALLVAGGGLYFAANDGVNGRELWKSDGTAAGTVLEADIAPADASSDPTNLAVSGGLLFFAANGNGGISEPYDHELWAMPLVVDADSDGVPDGLDCAPLDAGVWAVPGEVRGLQLARGGSGTDLQWSAPAAPGAIAPAYDVVRASSPGGFLAGDATCVESQDASNTTATDPTLPAAGFYYLVRATSSCGGGTLGLTSAGAERAARSCP